METTSEITKRYLEGKTLDEFAESLGIGAVRQNVTPWKSGEYPPSLDTLFKVVNSSTATNEAKAWARECLAARGIHNVDNLEPTIDLEVERRR
ncbi:MAG: hypothetical protein C0401_12475 [Anaerolinea sp.]|nr:hypothetical protein [Anaerolinea sp.]